MGDLGWSNISTMAVARGIHGATLLHDGRVLVTGGRNDTGALASTEVFNPAQRAWSSAGTMGAARAYHTATLLPEGKVLVAGGWNGSAGTLGSTELYDPAAGTWTSAAPLGAAREYHTATLLKDGRVLVTGGRNATGNAQASAEVYDPVAGTWSPTGSLASPRAYHTATLLTDGRVLVAGGWAANVTLASAELYDPATGTWSSAGTLGPARQYHTATLLPEGKVLVVGGDGGGGTAIASTVTYDPAAGTWSPVASLATARAVHTATLLPDGKVLAVGGWGPGSVTLSSVEVYDPVAGTWTAAPALDTTYADHTATLLPTGKVLIAGAWVGVARNNVTLYDADAGKWTQVNGLPTPCTRCFAVPLADGRVLVGGGSSASSALYDPTTGVWSPTGTMKQVRANPTVVVLQDGRVLAITGDGNPPLSTSEVYDPATGTWTATGALGVPRYENTATLLQNGKVLVTGGRSPGYLSSAQLFDPATGQWSTAQGMATPRATHRAVLLPDGKVLVAGGVNSTGPLKSAELYDPATNTWRTTNPLVTARTDPAMIVMADGRVMVASGYASGIYITSTEVFDPTTELWSPTGSLAQGRYDHSAVPLPDGRVLVVGGYSNASTRPAEIYDPTVGSWSNANFPGSNPVWHSAVPLPGGRVFVVSNTTPSTWMFEASGSNEAWRPVLSGPLKWKIGTNVTVTGLRFRGVSEASGGRMGNSPSDHPLLSLTPLEGSARWLPVKRFTSTEATVTVPSLPTGYYLATVFVNGLPGGRIVRVAPNSAPVSQPVAVPVSEDSSVGVTLKATDADDDGVTYTVVAPPTNGILSGTPPHLTYTPHAQFHGSDSFTYQATDGVLSSNVATVSLTVVPENDAPVAQDVAKTTAEDTAVAVMLVASDIDSTTLTYTVLAGPAHGSLSGIAPHFTYTPHANFHGTDSFTYRAHDGAKDSNVATVSLTVTSVQDAPVAQPVSATTAEDTAVAVVLSGTDADGEELTYSVSSPANGTLTGTAPHLTYTPNADFHGTDSFTYQVSDGAKDSNVATVSLTVKPENDAPVAQPVSATTLEDTPVAVTLTAMDVDSTPLTYTLVTPPANGTLTGTAPHLTYTPNANFHGTDSFTYRVSDETDTSNEATVSLTVMAQNDAPVAQSATVPTNEDTAVSLTLTATDVDSATLTYTVVSGPAYGTLSGTAPQLTYTPAANFHGTDSFTYRVSDGTSDSSEATVSFTVTPVNDAPSAQPVAVTTQEDRAVTVVLAAADTDGDTLTYTVVSAPAHGTLSGTAPHLTYTPEESFFGSDSFTYRVSDGTAESSVATVSVRVTAEGDAPIAQPVSVTGSEDTPVPVTLSATDADGDSLTYTVVSGPANGTLSGTAPHLTYTPNAHFSGTDAFTYKASDGTRESTPATVTVTVEAVNDAPVAQALTVTVAAGKAVPVTLVATDLDSTVLTYTVVSPPTHGVLSGMPPSLTYTSEAGFSGADAFTYKASDGAAESAVVTVSITVTPAPQPQPEPEVPAGGCGCSAKGESGAGTWGLALGLLGLALGRRGRRGRAGLCPLR